MEEKGAQEGEEAEGQTPEDRGGDEELKPAARGPPHLREGWHTIPALDIVAHRC